MLSAASLALTLSI